MSVGTNYGLGNLEYFAGRENGLSPYNKKVVDLAYQSQNDSLSIKVSALFSVPTGMFLGSALGSMYGFFNKDWFSGPNSLAATSQFAVCSNFSVNVASLSTKISEVSQLLMSFRTLPASGSWDRVSSIGSHLLAGFTRGTDAFVHCIGDRQTPIGFYRAANVVIPLINEYGQVIAVAAAVGGVLYYTSSKIYKRQVAADNLYKTLEHRFYVAAVDLMKEERIDLAREIIRNQGQIKEDIKGLNSSLTDEQISELVDIVTKTANDTRLALEPLESESM